MKYLIEYIDSENSEMVAIYQVSNEETKEYYMTPIEVCSKIEAKEKYEVIGEIIEGKIIKYDNDKILEEEDNYPEFDYKIEDDDV